MNYPGHKLQSRIAAGRILPALNAPTSVIVGLCLLAAFMFIVTTVLSRAYRDMRNSLGQQWFSTAEQLTSSGQYAQAILDYRNALSYQPRNERYLLKLSETLVAAGDFPEARGYLLSLWEHEPGSGVVNLQLARLEARTGNVDKAIRYYQNAVNGAWDDPLEQRRAVRLELAELLLSHDQKEIAEADLIALGADMPRTAEAHTQLGELFVRAGDLRRGFAEFSSASKIDPQFAPAAAGAGQTAFELGDYRQARNYLQRTVRLSPGNAAAASTLTITDTILNTDPFQRGLTQNERLRRVREMASLSLSRLEVCAQQKGIDLTKSPSPTTPSNAPAPPSDLYSVHQALESQLDALSPRAMRTNPDLLEQVITTIDNAENTADKNCGAPTGKDAAVMLILKNRVGAEQ